MKRILLMCAAALIAFACEKTNGDEEPKTKHAITVTGGVASIGSQNVVEAEEGDEITLTPNTLPGNDFVGWDSEDVDITDNTFTMPGHEVEIVAVFENTTYTIAVTGGTAMIGDNIVNIAAENDVITLVPGTLDGNDFVEWTSEDVDITDNTFTMPGHAVAITAIWEVRKYDIILDGGTAKVNNEVVEEAAENIEITLVPDAPEEGFRFLEWVSNDVDIRGNSFTMPAHDVTIEAEWAPELPEVLTGSAEVTFAVSPANAPKDVRWVSDEFINLTAFSPSGTQTVPTYDGFVEIVFFNNSETVYKFLLRDGDKVTISYDGNGVPQVTNTTDPGMNAVYNFPASRPERPMSSPDDLLYNKKRIQIMGMGNLSQSQITSYKNYISQFGEDVDNVANMPEAYKKYYKEAYFGSDGDAVLNDGELVRYYSVYEGINILLDKLMLDYLRPTQGKGGPAYDDAVTAKFDEIESDATMPHLTKVVFLKNMLRKASSFLDLALDIEYNGKYTDLSGDDPLKEYEPFGGRQPVIDIDLEDNQGRTFTLEQLIEDNAGKVIFVDLWATWCAPCLQSMPVSAKLKPMYPDVTFLYLSIDYNGDTLGKGRQGWIEKEKELELKNSYRVTNLFTSSFIQNTLQMTGVPRYLLFDRTGKLVYDRAPLPSGLLGMLFERYM